ncbi:MAG TPA: protein tyrosine phosphatase family protein [Candidatus Acidoferrales bacterium]
MKRNLGLVAGAVLLASVAVAQPQDFSSIKNFLRVNEQYCTGGQPTMDELAKLKTEGIKAIINLRRPTEYNAEEEAAKAKELGLRYVNIPVSVAEPKDEQADEFLKVTSDPQNRPAFIHCGSANRVGAFWMIRRVLVDGWKLEDAEAEARKIGMHSPSLIEFAHGYIQRHPKKAS